MIIVGAETAWHHMLYWQQTYKNGKAHQ